MQIKQRKPKQLDLKGLDCAYHQRDPYEMIHVLKRVIIQPRPAASKTVDNPPLQSGKEDMVYPASLNSRAMDPGLTPPVKRKVRRCTRPQGEIIAKLLREHCRQIGHPHDKRCEYEDGWSDERIALEVEPNGTLSVDSVYGWRKAILGDTKRGPRISGEKGKSQRARMEAKIDYMAQWMETQLGFQFPPELSSE